MALPQPSRASLVWRALRRRCPYCGSKGYLVSWFKLAQHCPTCGLATDRVVGHWVGAVGMNTMLTFGALFVVLMVGMIATYPDIAVAPVLAASVGAAVLVPIVAWPFSQTLWTAVDIMMRPVTIDELDPRYVGR
ncbi:MAG: hypothetical protein GEV08_16000 [Acidimicrobiia bacterium]|nr:hypothetical protein [Acidimicrobiia bacterium]